MLAGAGAAMEGFLHLMRTPLGYDPHNVMSVGIPVHDGTYKTWAARSAYFDQLLKKVAGGPGRDHGGDLQQCHAALERVAHRRRDTGQAGAGRSKGSDQLREPGILFRAAHS